jgi:hypothetical protein
VIRLFALAVLTAGVVAQCVQRTDPVFPLWYFTIDSAILAAGVLAWEAVRGTVPHRLRGAAAVAVLFSALIYAAVIAPGGWFHTGDDGWSRVATVLLHGVAPLLVVGDFLRRRYPGATLVADAVVFLWWPLAYLGAMAALIALGVATMPYDFLKPSVVGTAGLVAVIAALAGLTVLLGIAIITAGRGVERLRRRRA